MTEQLIKETSITADNEDLTLRYILTRNDQTKIYGAKIEKQSNLGEYETAEKENLFPNYPQASRFLLRLAKNTVTPMTLSNIIEDCFGM